MAIIDRCPDFTVNILVDGQPAEEYPAPDDFPMDRYKVPNNVCYIESKSGQSFSVKITVAPGRDISKDRALGSNLFVDGKFIKGLVSHRRASLQTPHEIVIQGPLIDSPASGDTVECCLKFSPISKIEDATTENIQRDSRISRHMGSILVVVFDGKLTGLEKRTRPTFSKWNQDLALAEKSMKGRELSHGTVLAPGQPRKDSGCAKTQGMVPLGYYYFQYRSHAALQKEYIIPQTPPPEESPTEDQIGPLTAEEIRIITEKRLRDKGELVIKKECQSPGGKRLYDPTDDDDIIEVASRPRFKVVKLKNGDEVLDLTEDSS